MDKYIYDESNGLWYELQGEYYLPCLSLPPEEEKPIGIWGQRHKRYLKEHRKATYTTLLTSGKLNTYLSGINEQAQERLELIIIQMKAAEGVTEALKASDQLAWVQHMNSIRNRAEEIILSELVYGKEPL